MDKVYLYRLAAVSTAVSGMALGVYFFKKGWERDLEAELQKLIDDLAKETRKPGYKPKA